MNEELLNRLSSLEKAIIANRDMPPDDTWSSLIYGIDKKLDITIVKMEAIHEQTQKTNGRVSKVEEELTVINRWRDSLNGKMIAYGSVLTFITPLVYWFITKE